MVGEVEPGTYGDAEDEHHQAPGYSRGHRSNAEQQDQGKNADRQRGQAGVAQVGDQMSQLADAVAASPFRVRKAWGAG